MTKRRSNDPIRQRIRAWLPHSVRRSIRSRWPGVSTRSQRPPSRRVDLGDLRRLSPISSAYGADRGTLIDRYYIRRFLKEHAGDIQGRVLEIGDSRYTRAFGGDRVSKSDVLHVEKGNPRATIVADLAHADHVASDSFDCIILVHTLQMILDPAAAIDHIYRVLAPGGVLLLSTHGIGRVPASPEEASWGVCWRMTADAVTQLLSERFSADRLDVRAHGNVLVATAFLYGLAAEELTPRELRTYDPGYQVVVNARARKPR